MKSQAERVVSPEDGERLATHLDGHIGARLRGRRTVLRMSQDRLAYRLGVSTERLEAFETGRERIDSGLLYDSSVLLRVHIRFFFDCYHPDPQTLDALHAYRK